MPDNSNQPTNHPSRDDAEIKADDNLPLTNDKQEQKDQQFAALRILLIAKQNGDLTPAELQRVIDLENRIEQAAVRLISALKSVLNLNDDQALNQESIDRQFSKLNKMNLLKLLHAIGIKDEKLNTALNNPEQPKESFWKKMIRYLSTLTERITDKIHTFVVASFSMMVRIADWFQHDPSIAPSVRADFADISSNLKIILKDAGTLAFLYTERKRLEASNADKRPENNIISFFTPKHDDNIRPISDIYYLKKDEVDEAKIFMQLALKILSKARSIEAVLIVLHFLKYRLEESILSRSKLPHDRLSILVPEGIVRAELEYNHSRLASLQTFAA